MIRSKQTSREFSGEFQTANSITHPHRLMKPRPAAACSRGAQAASGPPFFTPVAVLAPMLSLALWLAFSVSSISAQAASGSNDQTGSTSVVSLDGEWLLATDPRDIGRNEKWWEKPVPGAKSTKVPWIIQDDFPGYHGLAWYWRDFFAPANPRPAGRYLLRFWGVDYMGEVWLNGVYYGKHESGETPFVLDVTDAIKPGATNHLCVRVLNPSLQSIDGMTLSDTPHQARVIPYGAGAAYDCGGITDSVELMLAPAIRVEDLYASPDPKTGIIRIEANLRNAVQDTLKRQIEFTVAPAASGETLDCVVLNRELAPGDTRIKAELKLDQPHLWDLNDPFLYRVTAQIKGDSPGSMDEHSVRCGFRDFRFENGYFRLNGRRIFLRSSHTCNHFPIGQRLPPDPDMARRDLLDVKVMGFNTIRFIWGGAQRYQLDLCDEIGLMVYEESIASSSMSPSPMMAERFDRSQSELIRRDRNHPSIVIWGLLNEAANTPSFHHAVGMLPLVRSLDNTRMVFLNAGRYDGHVTGAGSPFSEVEWWHSPIGQEPFIAYNPLANDIATSLGFSWPSRQVCLHPGAKGEYSVARWTAPESGKAIISARFTGRPQIPVTTDVHVLVKGQSVFDGLLNVKGNPNTAFGKFEKPVEKGDTVDFAVGYGNESYGGDTTVLDAEVKMDEGGTYNLAGDFSKANNPAGCWSYGTFKPGTAPSSATFALYSERGTATDIIGSISNPGSDHWEDVLVDQHNYPRVPHTAQIIRNLRTQKGPHPIFLSEYGIGSAVDLWRVTRHFEELGKADAEDAQFYRDKLNRYLADYSRWKLADIYPQPEDFFAESLRKMAGQRTLGLNAIRANPNYVGYSLTGMNDHVSCGEGLTTTFRELKPGTVDALFEGFAPLRLCLFVEPVNVYRGTKLRLDAMLADEDVLRPGQYPVRLQVVGPRNLRLFDRVVTVTVPERTAQSEPPLALPVLSQDFVVDGPTGKYRFLASMEKGGAPTGGETEFYVADPVDMPAVETPVTLWGDDKDLAQWLADHAIKTHPFEAAEPDTREVILVGNKPAADASPSFNELVRRIARGSTAIFLSTSVFAKGDQPFGWLPLVHKGKPAAIYGWLYLKDEWAKNHPIFDGLPAGGLMDYTFYREIIPDAVLIGQDTPDEAVSGAIKASQDYSSGLMLSVYKLGAGRFVLNTLLIRENLGTNPVAERLLRNLLRYAARDASQPLAELPDDFAAQLKAMEYNQ
ncbi:MAG: glycoside hydrolase family 2 [Candidatus Omnitrophica bacterium]|nr:glycoside hydrolase family 2 [Candidatus Omnitrophota bacterium]